MAGRACGSDLNAGTTVIRVDDLEAKGDVKCFGIAVTIGLHNFSPVESNFSLHKAEQHAAGLKDTHPGDQIARGR
jgi:hypothetical protein